MKRFAVGALLIAACGGQTAGSVASNVTDSTMTVTEYEDMGRDHLTPEEVAAVRNGGAPPEYSSSPASSGRHSGEWVPCGVFREESSDIFTVHSLEHGVVIIFYRPDLAEEEILQLEDLVRELATHAIVMPRIGLSSLVVVAAWGRLGLLNAVDLEAIRGFWLEFAQRGPEPGVECPIEVDQSAGAVPAKSDY
jgi:hypothetical protein